MALKAKSSDTNKSSDDEDSKMKSYITRQFKKFMKNANAKGLDKDWKLSNASQFKNQDEGKKDAKDGGQYTVPPDQNASDIKALDIWNKNVQLISRSLGKAKPSAPHYYLEWHQAWGWFT